MSRKYFIDNLPEDDKLVLANEEYHHIITVMRTKIGEELVFTDGKGNNCSAILTNTYDNKAIFDITERFFEEDTDFQVTVFAGLMKGDKNEFIIQKCSELGITDLCFFESEFCIAKAKENKLERYKKIAVESAKQCGRSTTMNILNTIKFKNLPDLLIDYDIALCAYEKESQNLITYDLTNCKKIAVIIGSEGGFSNQEIDYLKQNSKVKIVSLGKRILRAETAAIVMSTLIMHLKGEL